MLFSVKLFQDETSFYVVFPAGKLTGQDLLQFVNAGFNPLKEISKTTGISMANLKDRMSDGAISAKMVEDAFKSATGAGGLFNHMMDNIAQTAAGKLAIFQGQLESFKIKAGTALLPLAEMALKWGNDLLQIADRVIPYIVTGVSKIQEFIGGITSGSSEWSVYFNILKDHVQTIWSGVSHVGKVVGGIIKDIFSWVEKSQLLQDIYWAVEKSIKIQWEVFKKVADVIKWVWDNFIKPQFDRVESIYRKYKELLGFGKSEIEITQKVIPVSPPGLTPTLAIDKPSGSGSGNGKPGNDGFSGGNIGSRIASSGPRNIYISGVKFTDKIEIHATTMQNGVDNLKEILENMFLQVLNSGASVQ